MTAGDIIEKVDGLTRDKLTYFVRAGYIKPKKVKRGTLYYNQFSQKDLFLVGHAWKYISQNDMRTRAAFERAEREYADPQLRLLE